MDRMESWLEAAQWMDYSRRGRPHSMWPSVLPVLSEKQQREFLEIDNAKFTLHFVRWR